MGRFPSQYPKKKSTMKVILVAVLAVCAYVQAASVGGQVSKNGREVVYTTADQEIYRISHLNPGYFMRWHDAQHECVQAGYKGLLSIKSAAAQEAANFALESFGIESGQTWIGLHRTDTSVPWTWADDTPLETFTNWKNAPPTVSVGAATLHPRGPYMVPANGTSSGSFTNWLQFYSPALAPAPMRVHGHPLADEESRGRVAWQALEPLKCK